MNKTMRRLLEFTGGVIIVLFLLGRYSDQNGSKAFVSYVTTNDILKIILIAGLTIAASRLITGRSKDYSAFFFRVLVKISRTFKKI